MLKRCRFDSTRTKIQRGIFHSKTGFKCLFYWFLVYKNKFVSDLVLQIHLISINCISHTKSESKIYIIIFLCKKIGKNRFWPYLPHFPYPYYPNHPYFPHRVPSSKEVLPPPVFNPFSRDLLPYFGPFPPPPPSIIVRRRAPTRVDLTDLAN